MTKSFISNPYNILGLPSDSTQGDVRKRVRLIEKMIAIDEEVSFDTDLFIDSADRSIDSIKASEGILNDPYEHMTAVFFWFVNDEPVDALTGLFKPYFDTLFNEADSGGKSDFAAMKDAAVGLSIVFELTQREVDFDDALKKWSLLIGSDRFWDFWFKYYKSIDYLDTSDRLLSEFRSNIESVIVEKFFEVSKLDDVVDASIVGKYFTVSSATKEKAAEAQVLRIKALRAEVDAFDASRSNFISAHVLNDHGRIRVRDLIDSAIALREELNYDGGVSSPAIENEFDGLWGDIMGLLVGIHNESGQHDAIRLDDLKFQKKMLGLISGQASSPITKNRMKENTDALENEIAALEERKLIDPEYTQLTELVKELADIPTNDTERIDKKLTLFEQTFGRIEASGKLKYKTLADAVSGTASVFNMIAVMIANDAQEDVGPALQMVDNVARRLQRAEAGLSGNSVFISKEAARNDFISALSDRAMVAARLESSLEKAQNGLSKSRNILRRLKAIKVDTETREKIEKNCSEAESTYNSIVEMRKQIQDAKKPKKSGGCYVATAVYGSYDCPQVWTLRRFRDFELAATRRGRTFIKTYYAVSPTLVRWFGNAQWFRRFWRKPLDRLVRKCQSKGFQSTPYEDVDW